MPDRALLLVNFGGPRSLEEIPSFLEALLTDTDVIRTSLPNWAHRFLFKQVARKRARQIVVDYEKIGGKSPIFEDTEWMAEQLRKKLNIPVISFHRYLAETHEHFLSEVQKLSGKTLQVFPLFPQFTYATTGSIARWFSDHLCTKVTNAMQWIKSYPMHPQFVGCFQQCIRDCMDHKNIDEEKAVFLFSAHGVPKRFICEGDIYQKECEQSFHEIARGFPLAKHLLSYQSQFGKAEWIRPSTLSVCESVREWIEDRKDVLIIPLSFTSDHIETLFEIEEQYVPLIREAGIHVERCPALNRREDWVKAICSMLKETQFVSNQMLIRADRTRCCTFCSPSCCSC